MGLKSKPDENQGNPRMAQSENVSVQVKDRFPTLRFTEEVHHMLNVLDKRLQEHARFKDNEELISSQILGLIFEKWMKKIERNREIYLFPYLQKKSMAFVSSSMRDIHDQNIKNVFLTFDAVILGKNAFEDKDNAGNENQKKAKNPNEKAINLLNKELL